MKATKLLESAEDFTHLNRFSDKLKDSLKDLDRHIDYLEGQLEDVKKARKDNAPGMDYVEKLNKDALRVCKKWRKDILDCINDDSDMSGYAVEYW